LKAPAGVLIWFRVAALKPMKTRRVILHNGNPAEPIKNFYEQAISYRSCNVIERNRVLG
jgi:hypothetical protein